MTPQCLIQQGLSIIPRLKSHHDDPQTSTESAQIGAPRAAALRVAILLSLRLYGAQTPDEIAARLGRHRSEIAKRCTELRQDGKIAWRETGTNDGKPVFHTRQTPTGAKACVCYLVP